MSTPEKDFLTQIKKELDASVDNLDAASRTRLNHIRSQALDHQAQSQKARRAWFWAGSAVLPAMALGLLIYFGVPGQQTLDQQSGQTAAIQATKTGPSGALVATASGPAIDTAELQILMSDEEIDMLGDLDFLTWLSSDEEVGG